MKGRRIYITGAFAAAAVAIVAVAAVMLLSGSDGKESGSAANRDAGTTGASQSQAVHDTAPGGTQEGIAVHGHWQIEVRDPDGRLVKRQEFENALTGTGAPFLVSVLDRISGGPAWGILLHTNAPDSGPCDTAFDMLPNDCLILESVAGSGLTSWPNVEKFTTLTIPTSYGPNALTLQGTAIASADGQIDEVQSLMCISLPPSLDPSVCNNGQTFTAKALATPVALLTGQQIIVTVTISFS